MLHKEYIKRKKKLMKRERDFGIQIKPHLLHFIHYIIFLSFYSLLINFIVITNKIFENLFNNLIEMLHMFNC